METILTGIALLTFVFAYLAVNTPDKHGPLQIGNYLLTYISAAFLGYASLGLMETNNISPDSSLFGLMTVWSNAFVWILVLVVAYFTIFMLVKAFEMWKTNG
jgi:hypothetical protein